MHRRAFLAIAAITPLAGCGGLFADVDTTLEDGEQVGFEVDEGAELTVTVEVEEITEPGEEEDEETGENEEADIERDSVGLQIIDPEENHVDTWDVEDSKTFDVTLEDEGGYTARALGGTVDITID